MRQPSTLVYVQPAGVEEQGTALPGETVSFTVIAVDKNGDDITILWNCNGGEFPEGSNGETVKWLAPELMSNVNSQNFEIK